MCLSHTFESLPQQWKKAFITTFYQRQTSLVSMETEISTWAHCWQIGPPHYLARSQKYKVNIIFSVSVFIVLFLPYSLVILYFELHLKNKCILV